MKILIDMNLSPAWVRVLEEAGHSAIHWSTIGSLNAPDREVLLWARIPSQLPQYYFKTKKGLGDIT